MGAHPLGIVHAAEPAPARAFWRKLGDLAATSPLLVWLVLGIGVSMSQGLDGGFGVGPAGGVLDIAAHVARIVFSTFLIGCLLTRRLPLRRSEDWLKRCTAILGVILPLSMVGLPRAPISPLLMHVSLTFILAGTVASVVSLFWLGRSFSILPQARGLVTSGPYRFVRHPLYLAEMLTAFGLMLQFVQPWAFLLFVAAFAVQLVRMGFEEDILREAFPEYRAYEAATARLIPQIY